MSTRPHAFCNSRGSVLIVALIFSIIIGVSLLSYLKLANTSLKAANRSFYANSAMNVAEIGVEQALACFNQLDDNLTTPDAAWPSPWKLDSTAYNKSTSPFTPSAVSTFPSSGALDVGPGATATVKIFAQHYRGSTTEEPKIVAKSTITQPDGSSISKYIEVTLRKRSLFANGLVAMYDVIWKGKPTAASWNSDPDNDGLPPFFPYIGTNKTAEITVGSLKGNIGLGGGEVWGYAKTGPTGTITGGSVHSLTSTSDDPTRRTNDFNATFPQPESPIPDVVNTVTSTIKNGTVLPQATDVLGKAKIDGKIVTGYFYKFASGAGIDLGGSDVLEISGTKIGKTSADCYFILDNHVGTTAVKTAGGASISINTDSLLYVYTNGNVDITGGGLVNNNVQAADCRVYGIGTSSSQSITINGNGELKAVVYAPNAAVTLDGGGSTGKVMGAVVAKTITMNGGTEFYWDEALRNLTFGNPFGLSKWRELTTEAERNAYATPLSF